MTLRYSNYITRAMVRAEPETLFVFGDNTLNVGRAGQAKEMRGEPNAIGIPTKWHPTMEERSFFRDENFDEIRRWIDTAFGYLFIQIAMGKDVVWPADGIGTGLAELPTRAPLIWQHIETGRKALERLAAAPLPSLQESAGSVLTSPGAGSAD